MKKTSILAALANGIFLVFSCGIIFAESIYKLYSPSFVLAGPVILVAGLGILVNGATALLFVSGKQDLNIRAAFLHLMSDALISLAVVLAAVLLYWTGWVWLDPVVGILIAAVILKGTWALFADVFRLIIDGVPRHISLKKIYDFLASQPGVSDVHDLHVWALSTQENALSVHLWMPYEPLTDAARQILVHQLRDDYHIHHMTIQVERTQQHCNDTCFLQVW